MSSQPFHDALARVIEDVVAPGAADVDASGEFPRKQVDALAQAGLLALTVPAEFGGGGGGVRDAAEVVRELGAVCGSTAMIVTMHYSAIAAIVAAVGKETLTAIAAGHHLSTLAFSETGSRSHFLAPPGTAGLSVSGAFDGLGLRGNASAPMTADGVQVPRAAMLGADGGGLDLALAAVLPVFLICSPSMSAGLTRRLAEETAAHLQRTQLRHLGQSLAQQVQPRAELARLRIEADRTWALVAETLAAVEAGRADAQLLVLEVKAAAGEAAADAADLALRAGGGAAFRKESVGERLFPESRVGGGVAPTTDALQDFIGRALCGLPLLGDTA